MVRRCAIEGQLSFASLDFAGKKKRTKRDVFLAEMRAVVPWAAGVLWAVKEKAKPGHQLTAHQRARNRRFGQVCAKVEHVFRVMKCQFGYRKVRILVAGARQPLPRPQDDCVRVTYT